MKVLNFALETYELALKQAIELQEGVDGKIEKFPEIRQENGLRQTIFRIHLYEELVVAQEIEVGKLVLKNKTNAH